MGVRQWLNERPSIAMALMGTLALIAIGAIVAQVMGSRKRFPSGPPDYYFTVDDGKTYFAASSNNYPPFDYNGQEAVEAYVYECNGKRFVGYLERYTPEARALMVAGKGTPDTLRFGRELKHPGDKQWVKSGDMATESRITTIASPDGQGTPVLVMP